MSDLLKDRFLFSTLLRREVEREFLSAKMSGVNKDSPYWHNLSERERDARVANDAAYVEFLESIKDCRHVRTRFMDDPQEGVPGTVEVCVACGMSRAVWEQGESRWVRVDLSRFKDQIED